MSSDFHFLVPESFHKKMVQIGKVVSEEGQDFFFLIQFNVPFKIISLIETSQSIGGAKREYPGKTT